MAKNKTLPLPGVGDRKAIKEVETLASDYVEKRDIRMAASKKEVEAKQLLIGALHKHKITQYDFEDGDDTYNVELKPTEEKLKVKKNKDDGEAEED